jgi:glucokinase
MERQQKLLIKLNNMEKAYLCIDIGGTKTALAIYGENAEEIFYTFFPTEPQKGIENLIKRIYSAVSEKLKNYDVKGGAIASPGPLNVKKGIIVNIVTMGWNNISIIDLFEQEFKISFKLINDCNAGALGEYNFGKAKGIKNMCYISISTGIGGGIIADGKLYEGNGNSAEFGHIRVDGYKKQCGCGKIDCLELYSSGTAIEKGFFEMTGKIFSAKEIALLAKNGDENALNLFKICSEKLSVALNNIISVLDSEAIILGGGMACDADLFMPYLGTVTDRLILSNLKGKQVLLGAYSLIKEK